MPNTDKPSVSRSSRDVTANNKPESERRAAAPKGLDEGRSGGELNFDDGDMVHPNGPVAAEGGTWQARGGDSGKLGAPAEIQSDHIGPSDPDGKREDDDLA